MCSRSVLPLVSCLIFVVLLPVSLADPGLVQLDEFLFDKVLSRFPVALIKFDKAFPYGDKHNEFSKFAKEQNPLVKDLVIGDVHIKDYGDKENWGFLKRFQINEKQLPVILLFQSVDTTKWLEYPKDEDVSVTNLKNFMRKNTKLYIGLSGSIKELDEIAGQFMEKFNRNEFGDLDRLQAAAEKFLAGLENDEKEHQKGLVYLQIIKRIREKGVSFKEDERIRVTKLLGTKITPQKKKELEDRLNILLSFRDVSEEQGTNDKLEL